MVTGEQITETEFVELQENWNALKSNTGSIKIYEIDKNNNDHAGFKDKVLGLFGKLMSKPVGRKLVHDLVRGSKTVSIQPSATRLVARTDPISMTDAQNPKKGSDSTIELDADGKPKMAGRGMDRREKSSKTATAVVQLQQAMPRARVVYCSATSVSHPKNLGFMNRLGLWGYGTEVRKYI